MTEPISEVYNMDCVAYMKTLPDKYFDLACVDPPYGDASGGDADRFGQWFDRYKPQITPHTTASEVCSTGTNPTWSRFNGNNFKRYRERVNHAWGGAVREICDPQRCTRAEGLGAGDTSLFRKPYL